MANGSNHMEALEETRSQAPHITMVLTAGHLMVEKEATEQASKLTTSAWDKDAMEQKVQKNAISWYHSHVSEYNIVQMVIKQPTINLLRLQVKNCKPTSLLLNTR